MHTSHRDAVRSRVKWGLQHVHRRRARPLSAAELGEHAVVFAPHPDDETLGCGGTIVRKRRAGADVTIVFMTDGSRSHEAFITPEELARVRHGEAGAACAALGVDGTHMEWIAFRDGALAQCKQAAIAAVRAILRERKPTQVFLPYTIDEHPDHRATREIVFSAFETPMSILEYPIWFLHHWPWVVPRVPGTRDSLRTIFECGLHYLVDFDIRVALDEVRDAKRAALAAHVSQTVRPEGSPDWQTLADVSDGEFLAGFFEAEIFQRTEHGIQ